MFSNRFTLSLLPLLFLMIGISGSSQATAQTTVRQVALVGKILDQNREAIREAAVIVTDDDSKVSFLTTTNEQGEFSLALLPGKYRVVITAEGFAPRNQAIVVKASSQPLEIVLDIANATAVITITDTPGYLTEALSSAMHRPTLLRDIPQSISVVAKEQIKDQSLQSISDVVAYIPGVTAHQGENNRDQLIFRGNSSSADFFVNGVRDDVQYYRDLYNVDRVEAIKGPNSMVFGRGGGGGVINRVIKEPMFTSFREVNAQLGSFGNRRFTTDLNQRLNNSMALRLNGLYENSDSFRQFVGLERYGLNPTLTWSPNHDTRVTGSYEFFRDRRVADRGIPSYRLRPADTPIDRYFGNPDDSRVRADVNLASVVIDHNKGRFNIRNRTLFGDYDRFYQNYVPGTVTADKSKVALTSYNNSTRRRNLFNQTDLTFDIQSVGIKHNLVVGAELGRQVTNNFRNTGFFNNTTTSILVPYEHPTIYTPVTFRQSPTDANNHLKTNLAAGYLQDQIEITRYFQIVTGMRFDYFDLNFRNNRSGANLRRIDRLVSPRAGVIIKPVSELSLYANYSVAYLPSSGDQFSSLTAVTQQVKPEKFSNYEVGMKWDVKHLSLATALYRQDRTNTRANDPNDPTRILQTGSQRTNGFEFGVNGTLTNRWSVVGGYTFQDAFIVHDTTAAKAGALVAQVPRHTVSLWNNYRVWQRLSMGLGIVRRTDMFAAIDNTVVLAGFTRADAGIFYSVNERWRLQANIQNVFDTRYYLNADNNNNISPGSGRGVRVGLTTRF